MLYEIRVSGLCPRNKLEMHISIHHKIPDGIELIARVEQGKYLVKTDGNIEIASVFRNIVDGIFREYLEDDTMIGYLNLPIEEYNVKVRELVDVSDELIEQYKESLILCDKINEKLAKAHLKSNLLLRDILAYKNE